MDSVDLSEKNLLYGRLLVSSLPGGITYKKKKKTIGKNGLEIELAGTGEYVRKMISGSYSWRDELAKEWAYIMQNTEAGQVVFNGSKHNAMINPLIVVDFKNYVVVKDKKGKILVKKNPMDDWICLDDILDIELKWCDMLDNITEESARKRCKLYIKKT